MNSKRPAGLFIIAMIIFGTMAPFVRAIHISSGALALCRALMAVVLIGLFLVIKKEPLWSKQSKKGLILLLLSGGAMAFNWILLFEAYKYTTVSVATLSYYFAPVLVTVLCPLLFKEKMRPLNWLCFIFSTLGIVLLTGIGQPAQGQQHWLGIAYGLGAAALYATVMLLNKAIREVAGLQRTFLQFISASLVLIPYVLLTGGLQFSKLDTTGIICLLVVGIVHTGITYCMYFTGLKELPGQKVAILSYIDPLVAVVISVTVLQEPITLPQIIGGILILGFTLLNELKS